MDQALNQKIDAFIAANKEQILQDIAAPVSYTHLRAHETDSYLVCRLLLEKKKNDPQLRCRQPHQ